MQMTPAEAEKFWSRVDVRGPDECWLWMGAAARGGYGSFRAGGRNHGAHRISYVAAHGQIPEVPGYHGGVVRHACDNPPCVNPRHLLVGSQADNALDAKLRGRIAVGGDLPHSKLSPKKVMAMREMRRAGAEYADIGARFGVSKSTAVRAVCGDDWGHVPGAVGPRTRRPRLGKSQVLAIRMLRGQGLKHSEIAEEVGVGQASVSRVLSGHGGVQ